LLTTSVLRSEGRGPSRHGDAGRRWEETTIGRRDYIELLGLSALWGASYLFIKIALDGGFDPVALVCVRLVIAAALLYAVARRRGLPFPRDRRVWRAWAVMGLIGTALPFVLVSWGETHIDSSLAAILNATVPIFTVGLAHVWGGADERITLARIVGAAIGFAGVVVVVGDIHLATHPGALLGVGAVLLSSFCYAVSPIYARGAFRGVPPVFSAMGQMGVGALYTAVPAVLGAASAHRFPAPGAVAAMLALTVLGTVGAYLLYYSLLARIGPTRTTSSTYLLPVFAVVYGAVFLQEPIGLRLLLGFALIVAGVVFITRSRSIPPVTAKTAVAAR